MSIVDEIQTGYDDPRWIEKSNSIKTRDNYTCQLCRLYLRVEFPSELTWAIDPLLQYVLDYQVSFLLFVGDA